MTDLATALQPPLGTYRGLPIIRTSIAIGNAGDGLSKAMGIAPEILEPRDTVMVLLECEVGPHELIPTIVDDKASASKLRKVQDRIAKATEAKKGQERLDASMDADALEPPEGDLDDGDPDNDDPDNEGGDVHPIRPEHEWDGP